MDSAAQQRSIRVAVRVRPLLPTDGATETNLLQTSGKKPNEVLLTTSGDSRTARRYVFDHVFGPDVRQSELYERCGLPDMVRAAADGYHATVFAYGQTGSGKTYTMEGYRYHVAGTGPRGGGGGGHQPPGPGPGASPPQADFDSTPEDQLGLVPRALRELFEVMARQRDRRFTVKCSFVQIYREQVYDLLNPATLADLPLAAAASAAGGRRAAAHGGGTAGARGGRGGLRTGPGGALVLGPLKLRWSKAEEFYLENLFAPEVESYHEAMAAFQAGVANKVMSSHRLNASSSRSHCLFTLTVTSSPVASPLESRSARLTLVDLAGSERAALTGATEGALRDESVSINKSLFTLRQVITALTDAAATAAAANGSTANGSTANCRPPTAAAAAAVHVPYRDSKLTCLLKHSLGGNALALMLACLSPADRFLEENASTLEYAARARRITNQVAVNEDPRSRLIRELRAEVAFLRQQLEAAGTGAGAEVVGLRVGPTRAGAGTGAGAGAGMGLRVGPTGAGAADGPGAGATGHADRGSGGASPAPGGGGMAGQAVGQLQPGGGRESGAGDQVRGAGAAGDAGPGWEEGCVEGDGEEAAYAAQLRGTDVELLVRSVIQATRVAVSSSKALAGLRAQYARTAASLEAVRAEYDSLAAEDARLRDKVAMLEALVGGSPGGGSAGGLPHGCTADPAVQALGGSLPGVPYTASTAAYIELEELRRENALLHERLQVMGLMPNSGGGAGGGAGGGGGDSRTNARGHPPPASGTVPLSAAPSYPRQQVSAGRARGGPSTAPTSTPSTRPGSRNSSATGSTDGGPGVVRSQGSGRCVAQEQEQKRNSHPCTEPHHQNHHDSAGQQSGVRGGGAGLGVGGGFGAAPGRRLQRALSAGAGRAVQPALQGPSVAAEGGGPVPSAFVGGRGVMGGQGGGGLGHGYTAAAPLQQAPLLSQVHFAVTSRALAGGVRLSTTGGLLPSATARIAVEAAGGGAAGGIGPTGGAAEAAWGSRPSTAWSAVAAGGALEQGGEGAAAQLAALLAERNALTRQRLAG